MQLFLLRGWQKLLFHLVGTTNGSNVLEEWGWGLTWREPKLMVCEWALHGTTQNCKQNSFWALLVNLPLYKSIECRLLEVGIALNPKG